MGTQLTETTRQACSGFFFDNVTFKNITFKNGHSEGHGGAVVCYSEGYKFTGCTFNNNTAEVNGGAINAGQNGLITDCTFNNNYANMIGAISMGDNGLITDCTFNNNSAMVGGAILGGSNDTADSCIFKTPSDTTSNVNVLSPILRVDDITTGYNSGDKLIFNLTTHSGMALTGKNITITIYQNNNPIANYACLSDEGWTINLNLGIYKAVCKATDYNLGPVNATIRIALPLTSLNQTINENQEGIIDLNYEYHFDPLYDSNFTKGIIINRPVTINGNGHTINGKNQACIFNIISSNITLTNITFTKGQITGIGGVINWIGDNGTVIGCAFTNNKAEGDVSHGYAGAIYWEGDNGIVKNTTFINNVATLVVL